MKIGIVCDNYKVTAYRNALIKADLVFTETEGKTVTTFQVIDTNKDKVQEICTRLETYFKAKRN